MPSPAPLPLSSTGRAQPLTEHLGELEDTLQKLLRLHQQQEVLLICSPHFRRHLWGHPGVLLPTLSLECPRALAWEPQ